MAREELKIIQVCDLTNNCPECYNQELKLTFYQKHLFSRFYHKTTNEITQELLCKTCGSIIYPVKWDQNTENAFGYYKKMVKPENASMRYSTLFYSLILSGVVLAAVAIYLFMEGFI